jgi:hypothetical protein
LNLLITELFYLFIFIYLLVDIKDIFLENKKSLIAAMIVLLLLIITFLWAKRKNSEVNNIRFVDFFIKLVINISHPLLDFL